MPNVYFSVDQLIQLLGYFPPNEGYYRIMLIQSVFSHIVDLENMHLIIDDVLTHGEQLEVCAASTV